MRQILPAVAFTLLAGSALAADVYKFNPYTGNLDNVGSTSTVASGGTSTLAVATGTSSGYSGTISSPTATINFNQSQFSVTLKGGSTAFVSVNPASVTVLGATPPAASIAAGSLGASVLASSVAAAAIFPTNIKSVNVFTSTVTAPIYDAASNQFVWTSTGINFGSTNAWTAPQAFNSSTTFNAPIGSSGTFLNLNGDPITTAANTLTWTNKTYGVTDTGNTFKGLSYLYFLKPVRCDGVGATMSTASIMDQYYGQCQFSGTADQASNWAEYDMVSPPDIDSNGAMRLETNFGVRIGTATDTNTHRYVISYTTYTTNSVLDGFNSLNPITVDFAGAASGGSGTFTLKGSATTLTSWHTRWLNTTIVRVRLARDGDDAADASAVNSYSQPFVIRYLTTQ